MTAAAERSDLDARGLGSPTTLRFVLLLLLFVAGAAGLSGQVAADAFAVGRLDNTLGCALAGGLNPDVTFRFDAFSGLHDDAAVRACWARFVPNTAWVPWVVVPALLLAAAVLYWLLPRWKGRRSRLAGLDKVDRDGRLRAHLAELVAEAGLRDVRFGVDPTAITAGAVVFGTRRRPVVRLHGGLLVTHETDYQRFRAVVLHELAHIRNGDVLITYATVAMWRVFLAGVLLPSACAAVYELVTDRSPAAWHISLLPVYGLIEEALIVALVYLTRADILRTRELHADLTAARQWHVRPTELVDLPSNSRPRRRILAATRQVLLTHPSWLERGRTLVAPDALFSLGAWPMFATGLTADIFTSQLDSVPDGPALLRTARVLLTAGLITAIGGIAIWRAVLYASLHGKPVPSGWLAGWWLAAGLAVGELVTDGAMGGGWLPPHPEALLILVAVVLLLTAWTTQYAQLRIRQHSRSLRAAMLVGLVPAWLVLAFVLTWWRLLAPVNGWLPSNMTILDEPGMSTAHPPLLVRISAVIASLPGADGSFAGLWWAIPLLWLLPLVLWTQRPRLPSLQRIVRAGLVGGLVAAMGLLAARIGVATVLSWGNSTVDADAEFTWVVLVVTAAMLGTAAVVGATSATCALLAATIASGVVAVVGTFVAFVQLTIGGCLGPANALFVRDCAIRPDFPFGLMTSWVGYVLGPATIVCLGVAAIAHMIRRHPSTVDNPARAPRRRAVAIIVTATVLVTVAATVDTTFTTPAATVNSAAVVRQGPTPTAQTRTRQVEAWDYYGGRDLAKRIYTMGDTTLSNVLADTSDVRPAVSSACARLATLTKDADDYLPVPVARGQRIWANAVNGLDSAAQACHRVTQANDLNSFLAAYDDVQNAETELDALAGWMGPVGTAPGEAPVVTALGEYQPLTYQRVTYRFTPANLAIRQTDPAERVATLDVEVCIAGLPPNTKFAGAHPGEQLWRLVFPDGTQVASDQTAPAGDFDAPLYPPGTEGKFSDVNDCIAGMIPFDIPATEHGDPRRVVLVSRSAAATLTWSVPRTTTGDVDILGTPQQVSGGGPGWAAVTGYSVDSASRNGTITNITVRTCASDIPTTAAGSSWTLLLADGVSLQPVRSAADDSMNGECRSGTIPFDTPAGDKSDPVEIQNNSSAGNLFWRLLPPTQ